MKNRRLLAPLLLLAALSLTTGACKEIRKWLPATEVRQAEKGTPEALVMEALRAGQVCQKDGIEAGWAILRPILHSDLTSMRSSEESFYSMNFPAYCRKVNLMLPEDGTLWYKLDYWDSESKNEERDRRLFVVTRGSDMPAPFRINRDPKADGAWRVKNVP